MRAWAASPPVRAFRDALLAVILLLPAWSASVWAQGIGTDAAAKAKLLGTLVRFVQWPAGTFAGDEVPLRLCVMHQSAAVEAAFAAHHGGTLSGRRVVVAMNLAADAPACHVLVVDDSAARAGVAALARLAGSATLVVGSGDGFLATGGMVELINVNDRYRFDIDLRALREANLVINPGVLKLARQVRN